MFRIILRKVYLITIIVTNGGLLLFCNQPQEPRSLPNDGKPITPQKVYTKEKPAEWADFAADHVPAVEISQSKLVDNVIIYVLLKNLEESHYIESIGILDDRDREIVRVSFGRGKRSSFYGHFTIDTKKDLSKYRAFARCSQHDLWVAPLSQGRAVP